MGDPAGIGPEVTLRACAALDVTDGIPVAPIPAADIAADDDRNASQGKRGDGKGSPGATDRGATESALAESARHAHIVILGDADHLEGLARDLGLDDSFDVRAAVHACATVEPGLTPGKPRPADARVALDCIVAGADMAASGDAAALVTAPVSKAGIAAIEPGFRGHTEFLAARAGVRDPLMVFAGIQPAVALLTTHLPLATALAMVRRPPIIAALDRLHHGWQRWFGAPPRIGVAGLNPHAGERGLLGCEEETEILPAIAAARDAGLQVTGPFPADSIFRRTDIDVILALYHDQGTIIAKRAPTPSVNLTLGLPYPRTSPDHGVAYDIAGRGLADPAAMIAAIHLAAGMVAGGVARVRAGDA
jgi:4-hydroxythreonine-4-phosphate dehydrogenase